MKGHLDNWMELQWNQTTNGCSDRFIFSWCQHSLSIIFMSQQSYRHVAWGLTWNGAVLDSPPNQLRRRAADVRSHKDNLWELLMQEWCQMRTWDFRNVPVYFVFLWETHSRSQLCNLQLHINVCIQCNLCFLIIKQWAAKRSSVCHDSLHCDAAHCWVTIMHSRPAGYLLWNRVSITTEVKVPTCTSQVSFSSIILHVFST